MTAIRVKENTCSAQPTKPQHYLNSCPSNVIAQLNTLKTKCFSLYSIRLIHLLSAGIEIFSGAERGKLTFPPGIQFQLCSIQLLAANDCGISGISTCLLSDMTQILSIKRLLAVDYSRLSVTSSLSNHVDSLHCVYRINGAQMLMNTAPACSAFLPLSPLHVWLDTVKAAKNMIGSQ